MADKIRKTTRKVNFTTVNNDFLQDVNLSWKSKGIIVYILSLPPSWEINLSDLKNRSTDGRDSTASGLRELIENGYCERITLRNENGTLAGYDYTVSDIKEFSVENSNTDLPNTENSNTDLPNTENPNTGLPTQLNTNYNKENNKVNTNYNIFSGKNKNTQTQKKEEIDLSNFEALNLKGYVEVSTDNQKGRKSNENVKNKRFTPPTIDEIKSYCAKRENNVDADKFFNFYESKGWMIGKNKMKDWQASIRTWERSDQNTQDTSQKHNAVKYNTEKRYEMF